MPYLHFWSGCMLCEPKDQISILLSGVLPSHLLLFLKGHKLYNRVEKRLYHNKRDTLEGIGEQP